MAAASTTRRKQLGMPPQRARLVADGQVDLLVRVVTVSPSADRAAPAVARYEVLRESASMVASGGLGMQERERLRACLLPVLVPSRTPCVVLGQEGAKERQSQ